MKKYLIAVLVMSATIAAAQDERPELPRALVKISPLQFFAQTLELSIESLNADFTRAFQISGALRSGQNDYREGRGGGGTLAYRRYVRALSTPTEKNPEAYQGVYYSLFGKVDVFKGEEQYWGQAGSAISKMKVTSISPGFTIGVQRTFLGVLFLDVYLGGGIKFADITYEGSPPFDEISYDLFHPAYDGIYPVAGVKVGVGL